MKTKIWALISFYGLILFGLMSFLAGCDKDDDKPSIVGTYTLIQENTSGCIDPADNGNKTKTCTTANCETLTISSDGTFSVTELDNGITTSYGGTYLLTGNQITFSFMIGGVADTDLATFQLSGSQLILTFEQETDGCIDVDTYIRK